MADRSTAAVDVADESGATPDRAADTGTSPEATRDKDMDQDGADAEGEPDPVGPSGPRGSRPQDSSRGTVSLSAASDLGEPVVLHSGHKLASRYRLEECVTRSDGFSSWRAVDEMLRRAVGVHALPSNHSRAKKVLAAARSAALLGDPRFVQVLDAVEENNLVYVVHEWLPDAVELTALLAGGPLPPYDADQMVRQLSEAMAAAHREGLAHLRLDPHNVLRTESGQYRIRGLAVAAALHGTESDQPKRDDTRAIGALLYASLAQRWPHTEGAHGLPGLPSDLGLVAPDQVRAGVHRGLSELAMRALVNDGSTASREEPACTTPEELAKAAARMPKVRPPEPELPSYQRPSYPQTSYRQPPTRPSVPRHVAPPVATMPPPTLPGRTGKALKWSVAALLIAALGLGSWQIADALLHKDKRKGEGTSNESPDGAQGGGKKGDARSGTVTLRIAGAQEFSLDNSAQAPGDVAKTYDRDRTSYWRTKRYNDGPTLAPYKPGVGIVYDLGSARKVSGADVALRYAGERTSATLYAAPSLSGASLASMDKIGSKTTRGQALHINAAEPVKTRYVLLWITEVPNAPGDQYSSAGYKQAITDLTFTGLKK